MDTAKGYDGMLKVLFTSILLMIPAVGSAALVTHSGYSRPTNSQIITGGGLEWMRWDLTFGRSINSVLNDPVFNGWRLASLDEMASLFNTFSFGKNDWQARNAVLQYSVTPYDPTDLNSSHQKFHSLFGLTSDVDSYRVCDESVIVQCHPFYDRPVESIAWYGDVQNSQVGLATISDDSLYIDENGELVHFDGYADLSPEYYDSFLDSGDSSMKWIASVALVRDPAPVNIMFSGVLFLLIGMSIQRQSINFDSKRARTQAL